MIRYVCNRICFNRGNLVASNIPVHPVFQFQFKRGDTEFATESAGYFRKTLVMINNILFGTIVYLQSEIFKRLYYCNVYIYL